MYIVSTFLDIEIRLAGARQGRLENKDPRIAQSGVNAALDITLPAGTGGNEIRVFCERLQASDRVEIDGAGIDTVRDLYLERSRAMRTFTPAAAALAVNLNLTGDQRAGTILAWLTSSEIEITDEVIVTYPFSGNTSPRVTSDRKEGGDDIIRVIGREPKLELTVNLRAEPSDDPDPDDKLYKILRNMSPQGEFFFYGRNLSEAYIIGKSTRRSVRYVVSGYGREAVRPVEMEVL